jgi:chemotaxis protein MotB
MRRYGAMALLALLMLPGPVPAQEGEAADYDAIQATIDRMQRRIEQMGAAAAERDQMLEFLEEQIERAAGRISGSEETTEALRQRAATLNLELETLAQEREALTETVDERAALVANLESQISRLTDLLAGERVQAGNLMTELEARTAALEEATGEQAALAATLQEREAALEEAAERSRATAIDLAQEQAARRALETRIAALEAAQARALEERDDQLAGLEETLDEREQALAVADERIALLNGQLSQLNRQLGLVETLLGTSESQIQEQQTTIASLGQRLEQALIAQVEELSQYRSEFFGRLRQVLGDRPEIRIVGDRFVLQSELLFASGSSRLDPAGLEELRSIAQSLREVAEKIPPEIGWILRVDGHTDRVPVAAASPFDSNWELSTRRALSVVEFLIGQGIPPERLAATGFGEYHPIDPRDDEIAYRRNRRIEFQLTAS